jgi:hypothetical protein
MSNGEDHEKLKRICDARNKKGGKAAAAMQEILTLTQGV